MSLILKQIFMFFKLLNSDKGTNQIAVGIACGLILGFAPAFSLQTLLVICLILLFRVQIGAVFLSAFFFKIPAYLLDGIFHDVGSSILEMGALKGLFTTMYNLPVVPFTKFYNSVVMGSGVIAVALFPFMFFLTKFLVEKYREKIVAKFQETKVFKLFKKSSLYKWYHKYDQLY